MPIKRSYIRDNKRILGITCPSCHTTYVPPRSICGKCYKKLEQWVEVSSKGDLVTYTTTYYPLRIHAMPEPIVYALIKLDGADTMLPHIINEVDPEELHIGMRVEAVFKEQREGNILDINYFRPIG